MTALTDYHNTYIKLEGDDTKYYITGFDLEKKLTDRIAELEKLCEEFADSPHYHYTTSNDDDDEGCDVCLYCGSLDYEGHSANCPVTKWKALK